MTTTVISKNSTKLVSATSANHIWQVDAAATISTTGSAIDATGLSTGRTFYLNGTLQTKSGTGMLVGDASGRGLDTMIAIGRTGSILSGATGIDARGGGLELANNGRIAAIGTGVALAGAKNTLTNSGAIASSTGAAIISSGAKDIITNHGSVQAETTAIKLSGSSVTLTNNGIVASYSGIGFQVSGASSIVTNNAAISSKLASVKLTGASVIFTNNGSLYSSADSGVEVSGAKAIITSNGSISATSFGMEISGKAATATNNGVISASGTAVALKASGITFANNGALNGASGILITGHNANVINDGKISTGSLTAASITFSGSADGTLHNNGVLTSARIAITGNDASQLIYNAGRITGAIDLGGGRDYFDGTGGKVAGTVSGGAGNDIYVIDDKSIILSEAAKGGIDTVKSAVNWTLGDHFENLVLTGTGDARASGNSLANRITGNAGDNVLTGKGGADTFVFAKGMGHDTVSDFDASGSDHDRLDLSGLSSIKDWADLKAHHLTSSHGDLIISAGNGDVITLSGVKLSDFDKADVLF